MGAASAVGAALKDRGGKAEVVQEQHLLQADRRLTNAIHELHRAREERLALLGHSHQFQEEEFDNGIGQGGTTSPHVTTPSGRPRSPHRPPQTSSLSGCLSERALHEKIYAATGASPRRPLRGNSAPNWESAPTNERKSCAS